MSRMQDLLVKDLLVIPRDVKLVGKEIDTTRNWNEADRFENLEEALKLVTLNGHYLEFGVAWGTSINFIAERVNQTVYGFDSFDGLPEDWTSEVSFFPKGSFKQDTLPEVLSNVKLVKGLFGDTLPDFSKEIETTAFLHVDCDLYSSTKTIFEHIGHTLKPGSIIVFDEYQSMKDEHTAFVEWLSTTNFTAYMLVRTLGPTQVTFVLKERTK